MPVFLCEFTASDYKAFLDVKRLLREHRVSFEVESALDGARGEIQRIWLAAPSSEAVALVRRYYRRRHPVKSLGQRASSAIQQWRRRQR